MKRFHVFIAGLLLLAALVILGLALAAREPAAARALARRVLPLPLPEHLQPSPELLVLSSPLLLFALFGLYSAVVIVRGLLSFEDITAAKLGLDAEVADVRQELKRRGVRSIAELRAAAQAQAST